MTSRHDRMGAMVGGVAANRVASASKAIGAVYTVRVFTASTSNALDVHFSSSMLMMIAIDRYD